MSALVIFACAGHVVQAGQPTSDEFLESARKILNQMYETEQAELDIAHFDWERSQASMRCCSGFSDAFCSVSGVSEPFCSVSRQRLASDSPATRHRWRFVGALASTSILTGHSAREDS